MQIDRVIAIGVLLGVGISSAGAQPDFRSIATAAETRDRRIYRPATEDEGARDPEDAPRTR